MSRSESSSVAEAEIEVAPVPYTDRQSVFPSPSARTPFLNYTKLKYIQLFAICAPSIVCSLDQPVMTTPMMDPLILAILYIICSMVTSQELPAMNLANGFTLPPIGGELAGPVALENWASGTGDHQPIVHSKYTGNFVDCSDPATTLCNQGAWADFGLAVSGLIPKYSLCTKYSPSTSCISSSLAHCNRTLSETTNTMMIAFGRVVVSWCYDGGLRLTALDAYATCLSVAMFDVLTIRNCLTQINDPNAVGKPAVTNEIMDPQKSVFALPRLFNNVIDTYQSSTIICMHGAIAEACGQEAATLALGPAMEELNVPTPAPSSSTIPTTKAIPRNDSKPEKKDIFSKSRQFMVQDAPASAAQRLQSIPCGLLMILLICKWIHVAY